jgi:excisionase family DNA binding protein
MITLDKFMSPNLLTVKEVAKRLGKNKMTIYRWIWQKKLEAIKLPGGGILIDEIDLPTFMREKVKK